MIKINSWNEYDQLKSIILGSVYDLDRIPQIYTDQDQESFEKIVEETTAELNEIQTVLEQTGSTVLRPRQPKNYNAQDIVDHSPFINARDFCMAYGKMFFLTYGSYQKRRFQNSWVEDIVNQIINDNNLVVSANDPNFTNEIDWKSIPQKDRWVQAYGEVYKDKNLFHTASILKHNTRAIVSHFPGSPVGKKWMSNWLAQQGIEFYNVPTYGHIDANHAILREDTILTSNPSWESWSIFSNIITCPKPLKKVDFNNNVLLSKEIKNPTNWLYEWQGHFQEFAIEANVLSINPKQVLVSFYDKDFYSTLKNAGFEAIYVKWSHNYFWGGGLHCITCDLERGN